MAIIQEKNKSKWTKDGRSWYFDEYYVDINGEKKEKKSKYYKTRKEAAEARKEFLLKSTLNIEHDLNISFEKVYKEWLDLKRVLLKQTTFYRLEKILNKHISKFFWNYSLHNIKLNAISSWKKELYDTGMSLKSQNSIIGYFKELMTYARDNYGYDTRILSKIQKYRIDNNFKNIREAEWNFWTYEEFNTFIACVDNEFYYTLFNFLYFTGLRFGEASALNWYDIDFDKQTLRVNKTLTNKLGKGNYTILDPKTKNSIRNIDLDNDLTCILKKHFLYESKLYKFNKEMFVFGNISPISSTTFARWLNKYISISGVKKITAHGFRHSHVSLLIHLGCDSRDVAARVGDTVSVIESTYYHMFPSKKSNTINALNNLKNER